MKKTDSIRATVNTKSSLGRIGISMRTIVPGWHVPDEVPAEYKGIIY